MKTHLLFLLLLLFLMGFLAADTISPNEAKLKKDKLPKIKKENNVLLLKKSNFDRALKETKYLLVKFYVSLSQSSQNFSEEFAEAARQLKKEAPRIQFGKIDVTHQPDLRKEFNIQAFPTVKLFVNGSREDPIDCKGVRQASAFITWVKRRTGPSTVLINSTAQAEALIKADDLAVIGFFRELHNDSVEVFCETARDVPEMPFGMTASEDVCADYGIQKNTLVVFKKGKPVHSEVLEDGRQNKLGLTKLIKTFTLDLVTEYNIEILFVLVDTNEGRNGRIFEYFRIRDIDVPAVRILNLTSDAKYKMPADDVTVENLREFCQSYLNGKAKVHLSSEEIPEDWDKMPVKVLVGKNFNSIVFNKTRTVFVMFYAPWSHECRKLLPIWDKLGEQYSSCEDVIIAKIDVTANDILSVGLARYPFFTLFPAGSDYQEVAYAGDYTLEAFSEFLEEQSKTKAEPGEKDPLGGIKEDRSQKETVITEKEL
ncbi:protein disulfide-isomerase-like protein of the testis isoform X3 [Neopelma chrysocephalum]|uniref:protein disulfide-isomerase-like protein of the testis isoform X3 n=1 Tax=Neopelma chrysocephalum TaxID=114329 RepID=UPI000FCCF7FA|nr:protein disulfide-isomerase-like protein of the testis isoform X3 [Neopelma chrysocephalum]